MKQTVAILAGFVRELEKLAPTFASCSASIQWQGIDPAVRNPDYVPPLETADVVFYVLSPDCGDSCQLKAHLGHVEIKCQAEQSYLLPVNGADARQECRYFEFIRDLPVISLDQALQLLGDQGVLSKLPGDGNA